MIMHIIRFLLICLTLVSIGCSNPEKKAEPSGSPSTHIPPEPAVLWPYTSEIDNGQLTFFQPQIFEWKDFEHVKAWMAISFKNHRTESYGVVKIEADTIVDLKTRMVHLTKLGITEIRFDFIEKNTLKEVTSNARNLLESNIKPVSLDLMLASMAKINSIVKGINTNTKPPDIYYRKDPSILVQIDGKILKSAVKGTQDLSFTINTNWDLLNHTRTKRFYLLYRSYWLMTEDLYGSWHPVENLPAVFNTIPKTDDWKAVHEAIPAKAWKNKQVPDVIVVQQPSELILTDGKPVLVQIPDTQLGYVSNTTSDLLFHIIDQEWYFLVAGRWFKAPKLEGPWTFASDSLPLDFKDIPESHAKAHVLSSVPGSIDAAMAIVQAKIPVKAVVQKNETTVQVTYAGDPNFQPIQGLPLEYAVNTSYDVIKYQNHYYVCYQGVWFIGSTPFGPFTVASSIPEAVSNIPPDHPLHHVTYVKIYDETPTTVTCGYTSGYHHHYVSHGCVHWGTGWYYPPYYWDDDDYNTYPIYVPYPYTYGVHAIYDPVTGTYGKKGYAYGPNGGYGRFYAYNPTSGTYARGEAFWDQTSGVGIGQAYNPRTNTRLITEQGYNDYERWGETVITRNDQWATISKTTTDQGIQREIHTSKGGEAALISKDGSTSGIAKSADGDIYVGRDGSVYKRGDSGWQVRENGQWKTINKSSIQTQRSTGKKSDSVSLPRNINNTKNYQQNRSQLNRDHQSRQKSFHRQRQFQHRRIDRSNLRSRSGNNRRGRR